MNSTESSTLVQIDGRYAVQKIGTLCNVWVMRTPLPWIKLSTFCTGTEDQNLTCALEYVEELKQAELEEHNRRG